MNKPPIELPGKIYINTRCNLASTIGKESYKPAFSIAQKLLKNTHKTVWQHRP
jgi:hypothetical protein